MRLLKLLVILILFASAGLVVAGMALDERFEARETLVIDASPAQVWALVSDPRGAARWMPKEMTAGGIVSVTEVAPPSGTAVAAPSAAAVAAAGEAAPLLGRRFTYRQQDQSTITVEVVERVQGKRAIDRVVANSIGFEGFFPELAWGFEVAPAEGGRTALTAIRLGRAARPWGTVQMKLADVSGGTKAMLQAIASSVERAAKEPASEVGPIGAPAAPAAAPHAPAAPAAPAAPTAPATGAGTGTSTSASTSAEKRTF